MKIEKATLVFICDGAHTTIEYEAVPVKFVAHELIKISQPKLELTVPDSQIEKFRTEAKREWIRIKNLFTDFEAYQELYVRLKIGEYIRLEHAKQAYNDMVLASAPMKKKVFHFDYTESISTVFGFNKATHTANVKTESIEAWDEEHATLLFEKMHPGKSFDPPY